MTESSNLIYTPSETTHWRNLFPNKSQLLGSHNLNPGEELIVEIKSVSAEGTIKNKKGKEETVPIIEFTNAPPMVLNVTNTKTIASLYGESYEGWIGKSIQLFVTEVSAFGEKVNALRVRGIIPDLNEDNSDYQTSLMNCSTLEELQAAFLAIPNHLRPRLTALKDEMKEKLCES